jgi:hypothetical protein
MRGKRGNLDEIKKA